MKYVVFVLTLGALLAPPTALLHAQASRNFRARLSPVPMDLAMAATVAGSGSLTAALNGSKLTVTGTFDGLKSPATTIQVHKAIRGVRGPVVAVTPELQVTKATSGTISGTLDMTPQLIQDLQNSRLYFQLQSERAPDGNLWGWLMQETKR